eukprot:CAMPEP_0181310212 /NCGR_PEP_ID=MMETSP1101-20121128/12463_1 /TAXON_ID=46948 /ORGANISM="Rhodomonas abbreviata, Strain Caron Lab Isolate" /LENGTH=72 /DNA_ID=CAMNT_0023416821 /DNA_START=211 /DNA_END=426 /DNA_ORIENTATION=+
MHAALLRPHCVTFRWLHSAAKDAPLPQPTTEAGPPQSRRTSTRPRSAHACLALAFRQKQRQILRPPVPDTAP